ncbi:MAG: AAA family ATPase [Dorea sp.]|jgi:predicted ATP-binding protein involved in virulence|nr:AAA family ATPase [Dorea sp.]
MERIFITNLVINKVRHLKDIYIPLAGNQIKHLILTGKNGSGKTSVVEAMADYINNAFTDEFFQDKVAWLYEAKRARDDAVRRGEKEAELFKLERNVCGREGDVTQSRRGVEIRFNTKAEDVFTLRVKNHYILAYYSSDRTFQAEQPEHVEKIQLRADYGMLDFPRNEFVKYLLDLKMTEALARSNHKIEKADEIRVWFERLEKLLKDIFADETIQLVFDEETFEFHILQKGKEPFDFHTLSSGYQAVLDIVLDIMMRMQNQTGRSFDFNLPGIVLVDEMETHLHLELQKNIMPLLTTVFPNIQFIVTSHSPFILNSLKDVVIYDLEKNLLVKGGLNDVPYDGIVEGYFGADKLSHALKKKFEQYRRLVLKESLSDDELCEIAELEMYLDEIPDYLALDIATEYRRLKLDFMNREDIDD